MRKTVFLNYVHFFWINEYLNLGRNHNLNVVYLNLLKFITWNGRKFSQLETKHFPVISQIYILKYLKNTNAVYLASTFKCWL